jgi:hypothetical protein
MTQDGNVRRTGGNGDKGTYGVGRLSICAVILLLATGSILSPHATETGARERPAAHVLTQPMVMVAAAHEASIAASSLNAVSWDEMAYTSTCYASHPRRFRAHNGGATVGSTTFQIEGSPVYGRLAGLGSVALIKYNCFQPGTDEHISHEHIFVFAIQNGHVLQIADIPPTWSPRPRAMFGVDEYQTTGGVLIVGGHDATQLINGSGPVIMRLTYVWNGRALVQTTIRPTPLNLGSRSQTGARVSLAAIKTVVTGIQPNVGEAFSPDGADSHLLPNAGEAFDAAHSRLLIAGSMQNGEGYAVVDTARGRLVRTGSVRAQVISLGVDSVRERGYLLLPGNAGSNITILSVDLSNGRVLWDINFPSYELSNKLVFLKAPAVIDPTTGNVFFEVRSGTTGFLRVSPSGADLGWQALSNTDIFFSVSQFWMDGPHHRLVALEASQYAAGATLQFFDTRPHHPSFTHDLPYKPVTMAVDPQHGTLWAVAPGNDVAIYDTTTGAMRAQIGRENSYVANQAKIRNEKQTLALDTKRGVGFIGCAPIGCSIERLQPGHSVFQIPWDQKYGDPYHLADPGTGSPIAAGDGTILVSVLYYGAAGTSQPREVLAVYPEDGGNVSMISDQPNGGHNVSLVAADVGHPTTVIWSGNTTVHNGLTGDESVPVVYIMRAP